MKWILIGIIAVLVIIDRIAKKVHAWSNMVVDGVSFTDPSQGTFTTANMRPEYEGPGSHQWGAKYIDDIAWVYNNVCSRYWEKVCCNGTFDKDGDPNDEIYFDSMRDYNGKWIYIYEGLIYDEGEIIQLTTSYKSVVTGFIEIKALVGGGFQIHNKLGVPQTFEFFIEVCRKVAENS